MIAADVRRIATEAFSRQTIERLIVAEAKHGETSLVLFSNRVSDSIELDLILDGFDVAPYGENLVKISW